MSKKKKKLKDDQYITSGYIDYVPGSERPFGDSASIKDQLDYINECLSKLDEKSDAADLHAAYEMLKKSLGFNETYEQFLERFGIGRVKYIDPFTLEEVTTRRVDDSGEWKQFNHRTISPTTLKAEAEKAKKNDPVNHPSHYTRGSIEVIDFIEDRGLDNCMQLATAVKYIARAGYKDPDMYVTDLSKAVWYVMRMLSKFNKNPYYIIYFNNNPTINVTDFIKDQGLESKYHLALALFYICYANSSNGKRFLELAVEHLEKEIDKCNELSRFN